MSHVNKPDIRPNSDNKRLSTDKTSREPSSSRTSTKSASVSTDESVVKSVRPEIKDVNEAERVARSVSEQVRATPGRALEAQAGSIDEQRVRELLKEDY